MAKLLLLIIFFYYSGCSASQNEIDQMRYQCEEQGVINPFYLSLSFPNSKKIKNIKINRKKNGKIIESFAVQPNDNGIWIKNDFYIHDTYEFIIDGEKPFILTAVKTSLQTHCTWQGCKYPCEIDEAYLNGKQATIINNGIEIRKEGYE